MSNILNSFIATALLSGLALTGGGSCQIAQGQSPSPVDQKLPLRAALVLTPEFCATQSKKASGRYGNFPGEKEKFNVGQAACAELEPALRGVLARLTRSEVAPSAEDADVVLTPKFVDVSAHRTAGLFPEHVIVVLAEWTVKDNKGKTIWVETIESTARHKVGNQIGGGYKRNLQMLVSDSAKSFAEQSASKMSSSPELRKLNSASSTPKN